MTYDNLKVVDTCEIKPHDCYIGLYFVVFFHKHIAFFLFFWYIIINTLLCLNNTM